MMEESNHMRYEDEESDLESNLDGNANSSGDSFSTTVGDSSDSREPFNSSSDMDIADFCDCHWRCMNSSFPHNGIQSKSRCSNSNGSSLYEENKQVFSERGDAREIRYKTKIAKAKTLSQLTFEPRQLKTNVTVMYGISSFFKGIFGYDAKKTKKVRFRLPEDGFGVEMDDGGDNYFDGRVTPIPETVLIPAFSCQAFVANKVYKGFCCLKYRQPSNFGHELSVKTTPGYRAKLKTCHIAQEALIAFIRLIYWTSVQQIRKTLDFRQENREESEIGQIATKIWLFTFIFDTFYDNKDLTEPSNRKSLQTDWEHFIAVRKVVWSQISKTMACFQTFRNFAFYVYRKIKVLGRLVGLNIKMEKNIFKFDYGDGLQLRNNASKKGLEKEFPVQLKFEEKQSLQWYNFKDIPEEDQRRFLRDLLDEAKYNVSHVQVQIDFLLKDMQTGILEKDKDSFYKNLKTVRDSYYYFLSSSCTSLTAYHRLKNSLAQFSSELLNVFKNIRYILLRIMEVCDITELSAIYLSHKYTMCEVSSVETKFYKRCCRRKKLYTYKDVHFMQTYFRQELLTTTILSSRHCRLRLWSKYSIDVEHSQSKSSQVASIGSKKVKKEQVTLSKPNSKTSSNNKPISLYNYLESEDYKLKSILRKDTFIGSNVLKHS